MNGAQVSERAARRSRARFSAALAITIGSLTTTGWSADAEQTPDPELDVAPIAGSATTDALVSLQPARFADTRPNGETIDDRFEAAGFQPAGAEYEIDIAGRGDVPADAAGVIINVTAVQPRGPGFFTVHPCVTPRPLASALNYTTDVNLGNEVVAGLSGDGSLCIYTFAESHMTVDVVGYVPANNGIVNVEPARLLDTRPGVPTIDGSFEGIGRTGVGSTTRLQVTGRANVPDGVGAVLLNVAAVNPADLGFVTTHPCLDDLPLASSLNHVAGVNRSSELIVEVNPAGEMCLFTAKDLDLAVDVVGYVPLGTNLRSVDPARLLETRPGQKTADGLNEAEGSRDADSQYTLPIAGRAGVPDEAVAAVLSITAIGAAGPGFITAHPCVTPRPLASSLNYISGVNGGNEIIIRLDDAGQVCLYTFESTHLTVDVTGYLLPTRPAADDAYDAIGNTTLEVGVAPGTAPAVRLAGSVLDNDRRVGSTTVTSHDETSALGGSVDMNANGTFTYAPPAGVTDATDTFAYTVSDGGGLGTGRATVSIALDDIVWYVDNTGPAATADGRSATPFAELADAGPASDPGETVFVHAGDGTDTGYDQGIVLDANQDLLGEEVGLTVGGTQLVPAGARPKLSASGGANTVMMGSGSEVTGLDLSISGTGAAVASAGAGGAVEAVSVTANSEGIALEGVSGTFTFRDVEVASSGGASFRVADANADITFDNVDISQTGVGAGIDISEHTGTFAFGSGSSLNATNGTGLQFSDADGTYDFDGVVTLNGGDAGIDILGGSAGTFTFPATTTITNPTGSAVTIDSFDTGGDFDYLGNIVSNADVILDIAETAAGTTVDFTSTGSNSLTSTDNPNGAMFIFDVDGDLTITTPMTVTRPQFSALFATDGDGTWTFNDLTIIDQTDLNGGIDVFGNMGTVNFHDLTISTDSPGTGRAVTGFLAGGNNTINVTGNSSVDADGGGALVLINIAEANMTWQSLRSTNNTNTQIGFAGDDGIDLLNVDSGTIVVAGTTTVTNADGVGISVEQSGVAVTFSTVAMDGIGQDGLISGVAFDNPGSVTIDGGTISNTGGDGLRIGSGNFGSGATSIEVNNVTFTGIGGSIANLSNSGLAGSGNIAVAFSCTDLGGNTGSISFNAGADTCP